MPKGPQGQKRKEQRRAEYIATAKEAARRAARGKNYSARHAWFTIARAYQILAQTLDIPRTTPPESKKLPRDPPEDPLARGGAIMREATKDKPKRRSDPT